MQILKPKKNYTSSLKRLKTLSYTDGALYSLMVSCGENLVTLYLSLTTIDPVVFGLITTVPVALGAVSQGSVPHFVRNMPPRQITLLFVALQMFGLGLLIASLLWETDSTQLWGIALGLSCYWIGGMTAGPPWQQMMAQLIPRIAHNHFFARRSAFLGGTAFLTFIAVGLLLGQKPHNYAFAGLLSLGLGARFLSFVALWFHPRQLHDSSELPLEIAQENAQSASRVNSIAFLSPAKTRGQPRITLAVLCLLYFLFRISIEFVSPFYAPFLVKNLGYTPFGYTWLIGIPFLARALVLSNLGKLLEERRMYEGFFICMTGIALIPPLWVLADSSLYLGFLQISAGISWWGLDLLQAMLIQNTYPRHIMHALGAYMAAGALGSILGGMLGGSLLRLGFSYHELFLTGGIFRLVAGSAYLVYLHKRGAFQFHELKWRASIATILSLRQTERAVRLVPPPDKKYDDVA